MRNQTLYSPVGTGQVVAIGSSSAASTNSIGNGVTNPANIVGVRIFTPSDVWIEIGTAPVAAATTSTFLPAGSTEYFAANPDDKVAVLHATSTGDVAVRAVRYS